MRPEPSKQSPAVAIGRSRAGRWGTVTGEAGPDYHRRLLLGRLGRSCLLRRHHLLHQLLGRLLLGRLVRVRDRLLGLDLGLLRSRLLGRLLGHDLGRNLGNHNDA